MTILLKTLGVKKILKKVKIALDKFLICDTLIFIDECVPAQTGTFCFLGLFPQLPSISRISAEFIKSNSAKDFA
jgi:hypothetical protein